MSQDALHTAERPTEPKQAEKSLGDLFGEVTEDIGRLLRQEVELAKVELREEAAHAAKAGGSLAGAGIGGALAVLFLSLSLAWLLDQALNTALAFAIVGLLWAVAAFVLLRMGRAQLKAVKPLPTTRQTVKEDVQWLKAQTN